MLHAHVAPPLRVVRAHLMFRRHGVKYGDRPRMEGKLPYIRNEGTIQVGNRLWMRATTHGIEVVTDEGGELVLGDDVFLNSGCFLGVRLEPPHRRSCKDWQ